MKHKQKICLSCEYFRPKSVTEGFCRLEKNRKPDYPVMGLEDSCEQWKTSGQQYYIRVGWLKRQREMLEEAGKRQSPASDS